MRQSRDIGRLFDLLGDLTAREPHRTGLINTVRRQIIRAELDLMMGGTNATRANIHVDGAPWRITPTREPDVNREWDVKATGGTPRQNAVWNTSRRDTEVGTIRDVHEWAHGLSREELLDAREISIQIVGTSGPCEACKDRLRFMVSDLKRDWMTRTGLRENELPRIRLWSYYGNPPETPYKRGGYSDVRNGWVGDPTPQDLTFQNWANRPQPVREHEVDL